MEESGYGLFLSSFPAFAWTNWGKPQP